MLKNWKPQQKNDRENRWQIVFNALITKDSALTEKVSRIRFTKKLMNFSPVA